MTKFMPHALRKAIQPVETGGTFPNPLKESLLSAGGSRRSGGARPIQKHRTIFLSDMHLGTRSSRADLILDFLETHSAETVYLVGDIVDNWYPLSKWKSAHHQVLQRLFELPRTGTRVIYVPGNHDDFFRNYVGTSFGGIEIELDLVHRAMDGRRYLVTHGDVCDVFSAKSPLLERAGRLIERIATSADVAQRHVLGREGQPEWFGIERAISRTSAAVRKYDNFEERLAELAKSGGYDGIICGHYHQPPLHDDFGTTYANCGDWARNNTAIVEDFSGRLALLWAYDNTAFEPDVGGEYQKEGDCSRA